MNKRRGKTAGRFHVPIAPLGLFVIGIIFVVVGFAYPALGLQPQSGIGLPPVLAITQPQATVEISIAQGLGKMVVYTNTTIKFVSYANNPYGLPTTDSFPVNAGDVITFQAIADNGYQFSQFGGPNGVSTTENPWILRVCQSQMNDPTCPSAYYQGAFVHAYFTQCANPSNCSWIITITTSSHSTPWMTVTSVTSQTSQTTITRQFTMTSSGSTTTGQITVTVQSTSTYAPPPQLFYGQYVIQWAFELIGMTVAAFGAIWFLAAAKTF